MTSRGILTLGAVAAVAAGLAISAASKSPSRAAVAPTSPDVHYAPEENLEAIDVGLIDEARESVDIAAYVLTDRPVIEALSRAAARGVAVRVYRWPEEHEMGETIRSALAALKAEPGVEIRFKRPDGDLMHLKSYCVDGQLLRGGAANFSASGLKRQDNDLIVFRGAGVCAKFEAAFERMWDR